MHNSDTVDNNAFGSKLEQMLTAANIKNYTIAKSLNYDVSYISKWITGKAVPSKKNLENVLATVSRIISEQGSGDSFDDFCRKLGTGNDQHFRETIKQELRTAYYETVGESKSEEYAINNSFLRISPEIKYPLLLDYARGLDEESPHNIVVMTDLFSLDHGSKLRMAGIENHRFMLSKKRRDLKIDYVVDLSKLDGNNIYNVILLIHMMTCFSLADFHLYYSREAAGKLFIAVKDEFLGISILGENKHFICTTGSRDKKKVEELYESIKSGINPDSSLFFSTDMNSLLSSHEYLQTLLSPNARWLVGHVTEHFLPPDLFDVFADECFTNESEYIVREEAKRAHLLAINAIGKSQIRIMIYNRALVDFVLSGEMDFFNHKVILSPEQRKKTLMHIREMIKKINSRKLKIIVDGFSDDFKYITNPCMFLSDSLDYLRLENQQYENNIMLSKDEYLRRILDVFFENIWNCNENVFDAETDDIVMRLDRFIETSELLMNI